MFEVAVIGDSLTGHLSALALAERGLRVAVTSLLEGQHLGRIIEVPKTPLNDVPISGVELEERSWKRARQLGVDMATRSYVSKVMFADEAFTVVDMDGELARAKKIVFAPAGGEPPVHEGRLYELLGVGVSMDAWSDAPIVAEWKVRAAVIGCGFRAAEEALQCVRAGVTDVLVVCDGETRFGSLAQRISSEPIRIASHSRLGELHVHTSGKHLEAIDIIEGDIVRREPCGVVFLARGVECNVTLIDPFRTNPNVVLAGLAHGIAADDYPAMVADVARVVEEVCR